MTEKNRKKIMTRLIRCRQGKRKSGRREKTGEDKEEDREMEDEERRCETGGKEDKGNGLQDEKKNVLFLRLVILALKVVDVQTKHKRCAIRSSHVTYHSRLL
jgi:hypothetical protein